MLVLIFGEQSDERVPPGGLLSNTLKTSGHTYHVFFLGMTIFSVDSAKAWRKV